jgi:hypothetical protein
VFVHINEAQREIRTHFIGGSYGQLVSSALWLTAAALGTWSTPRSAIATLVIGGFFIFPLTTLLIRLEGRKNPISSENSLWQLGMQVAFVLPASMPLILPVVRYRVNLFFPAMMILLGAHYLPFIFLYGMRMYAALAAILLGSGIAIVMLGLGGFALGGWVAGVVLLVFAVAARVATRDEISV